MDFPYINPDGDLAQGDVLEVTHELQKVLNTYHPYYVQNKENRYFILLTQSCDLVRRSSGLGARYISLAPVRSAQQVVERQLAKLVDGGITADVPVGLDKSKVRFEQFLERLINNNEPDFFFLRANPSMGLAEDHCAILRLAISIRADEHYDTCLKARFLSIQDTFRAKLGWLVGELYSRVGTEDWPAAKLKEKIQDLIEGAAIWLEQRRLKQLKLLLADWMRDNPGLSPTKADIETLIKRTKDRKAESISRAIEVLRQAPEFSRLVAQGHLSAEIWEKVEQRLVSDQQLTTALR